MIKKIVITIILIMLILVNTISSYANTEITIEKVNESLRKIYSKDVKISVKSEYGTSNSKIGADDVEIGDSKIIFKGEGAERFQPINYILQDNICKFEHEYIINVGEDSSTEDAFEEVAFIMLQQTAMDRAFLAMADAVGIELSLAYTYYSQQSASNEENTIIKNDVFKREVKTIESENKYITKLEIDLQKMSELTEEDIDATTKYTVELLEKTVEEKCEHSYIVKNDETHHWEECSKCDEQKVDTKENHILGEYKDNGDGTQTANCSKCGYELTKESEPPKTEPPQEDTTIIDEDIPKAGTQTAICLFIILGVILLISGIKINKYKNI